MNPDLAAAVRVRDAVNELLHPEFGTLYYAEAPTACGLSPALIIHVEWGS